MQREKMVKKSEKLASAEIFLEIGSREDCRLFRNHIGLGWQGQVIRRKNTAQGVELTLLDPRPLRAGLCPDSADYIGWHTLEITPDMIGQKVAVFLSIEAKSSSGKGTIRQINWADLISSSGGIAGIVRSGAEAAQLIDNNFKIPLQK